MRKRRIVKTSVCVEGRGESTQQRLMAEKPGEKKMLARKLWLME